MRGGSFPCKPGCECGRHRRDGSPYRCPACGGEKSRSAKVCRRCYIAANASIPKQPREYHHAYRLRGFGLTTDEYDALSAAQGDACYACDRVPVGRRLSVDHDHKTGLVRGLLCNVCNRTLGHIERDGVAVVRKLLAYLESPPAVDVIGERYGTPGRVGTKAYRRKTKRRLSARELRRVDL